MLGRRKDQKEGDVLVVIKPNLSNSHGKLGSSAGCPPPAQGWRSPGARPHLSGGDRSRGGREGAGEWGAAEAGQGRGPWGPQEAGGEGGAADSPQHSTTVRDGVLITGVDAYRHKKDTEGSLESPLLCPLLSQVAGAATPQGQHSPGSCHTPVSPSCCKDVTSPLSDIYLPSLLILLPCSSLKNSQFF